MAATNQVYDPAHQHCCFACTCTRNHEHRSVNVFNGLTLVGEKVGKHAAAGAGAGAAAKSMASCPWGVCFMAQKKRKSIMDKRRGCGNLEIALGR